MDFIPVAQPKIGKLEKQLVKSAVNSGWISSLGEYIDRFETAYAKYFQTPYAVSVSNGTTALHVALEALDIGPGDEVILPDLTFVASANAVKYTGATPVFVDIDPLTWNINPKLVENYITSRTKAIMPVHLYGFPVDMKPLLYLAKKHHLFIVEDAAEAHGATYQGKFVGTLGDIGCFSFYGNKIITTGEGGMVLTKNKKLMQKIRFLKDHGMSVKKRYFHPLIGFNYRMTNIQAALGLAQLQQIDGFLKLRQKINYLYRNLLSQTPQIQLQPQITGIQPVCWLFSCLVKPEKGRNRDRLIKYLKTKNIDSRPFFYPLSAFPMYKSSNQYRVTDKISSQGINLPTFVSINQSQIFYIVKSIKEFFRN